MLFEFSKINKEKLEYAKVSINSTTLTEKVIIKK